MPNIQKQAAERGAPPPAVDQAVFSFWGCWCSNLLFTPAFEWEGISSSIHLIQLVDHGGDGVVLTMGQNMDAGYLKEKAVEMGIKGPHTSWRHMFWWNMLGCPCCGPMIATMRFFNTLNQVECRLNGKRV